MSDRIGEVVLLQIHGDLLVPGDRFDPTPLVEVDEMSIDSSGVLGRTNGMWAVDVHHRSWPGRGGRRPVSMGFTSHYDMMRDRFRDVPLGTAGENILVTASQRISLEDLGTGVVIRGADGRAAILTQPFVARPCQQFTSFMLALPYKAEREEIADELAFLEGGMRGFIFAVDGLEEPVTIKNGDGVFLL
ncbi:MAG: hypothetical protein QNJ77_03930 [Acidimicrobiia bacterium]|nr:hypothetical protein [Acidimicrobiia bacterium]